MFRLVLQTPLPTEETSCCDYPEVLEELQSQEVLPGHQERLLQTAGPHQGPGAEQEVQAGAGDDSQTAGQVQGLPCQAVPAEREVGRGVPAEAGQGLDSSEEGEESQGRITDLISTALQVYCVQIEKQARDELKKEEKELEKKFGKKKAKEMSEIKLKEILLRLEFEEEERLKNNKKR